MAEDGENQHQLPLPESVGERLRAAREARGVSVAQLSAETRITQRHLALIETDDFAALPGRTYAVGFARTYARAVGLDSDKIAREVRTELSGVDMPGSGKSALSFEPGDPARVPSARLAWLSAVVALVVFVAGSVFVWSSYIAPAVDLPLPGGGQKAPSASTGPVASPGAVAASPSAPQQVTFTALAPAIWVKFYDQDGTQLLQKQLAMGESYTVPADARGPMLWTARPDALGITVGGKPVAKLADEQRRMKDVPVSADALLARPAAPPPAPPTQSRPEATPSQSASPTG